MRTQSSIIPAVSLAGILSSLVGIMYFLLFGVSSSTEDTGYPGAVIIPAVYAANKNIYVPLSPKKPDDNKCAICGGDGVIGDGANGRPCWKRQQQSSTLPPVSNPFGYVVIFTSNSCIPCKNFLTDIQKTLLGYPYNWTYAKIYDDAPRKEYIRECNIDESKENRAYADQLGVFRYPTSVFFKDGQRVETIVGQIPVTTLSHKIPKG